MVWARVKWRISGNQIFLAEEAHVLIRLAMFLSVLFCFSGCERHHYTIRMTLAGDHFTRELECKRTNTNLFSKPGEGGVVLVDLDPDEVKLLATAYGKTPPDAPTKVYSAAGTFKDATPADIGGKGLLKVYRTTLGTAVVYAEQFRGTEKIAEIQARQMEAVDGLTDVAIAWLRSETGTSPGFENLRAFVDGQVRRDARNAAAFVREVFSDTGRMARELARRASAGATTPPRRQVSEVIQEAIDDRFSWGVTMLLMNQGYMRDADLAALDWCDGRPSFTAQAAWDIARRLVGEKLGLDAAGSARTLAFLSTDESANDSIEKFVKSGGARATLAGLVERHPWLRRDVDTTDDNLIFALAEAAANSRFFEGYDNFDLSLDCPVSPLSTNGTWTAATRRISWSGHLETDRDMPWYAPVACYASWVEPAAAAQAKVLGWCALIDSRLLEYAIWRTSLPETEGEQWDQMVAGLDVTADPDASRRRIEAFRFVAGSTISPARGIEILMNAAESPKR